MTDTKAPGPIITEDRARRQGGEPTLLSAVQTL